MATPWKYKTSFPVGIAKSNSYTATGGSPIDQMTGPTVFKNPGTGVNATINGVHNNSTTTINVLAGAGVAFKPGMVFSVTVAAATTEIFKVLSISTDALTVATRPFAGTAAATLGGESILPYNPVGAENGSYDTTLPPGGDGVIEMGGLDWGSIIFPTAWTAADLAFFCCNTRGGTYVPMRDKDGTLLSITGIATGASNSQFIPPQVFAGGPFVKMRSITVGTDPTSAVTQGADRMLIVVTGE